MALVPRKLVVLSRWLHTYLTMFGLLAMSFFAVTGLMLNHGQWFGLDRTRQSTRQGTLPPELARSGEKAAIVARLRSDFDVAGALEDFEADDEVIYVSFARPGCRTDVEVDRADGRVQLTTRRRGLAAIMAELHTGTAAGRWWRLLIDVTAVLLALAVVTGAIIWLSLPRRRFWGLVALLAGAAVWVGTYLLLVP